MNRQNKWTSSTLYLPLFLYKILVRGARLEYLDAITGGATVGKGWKTLVKWPVVWAGDKISARIGQE